MKILWIINIPLPEVSSIIGEKHIPYGGWLVSAANRIAETEDIELSIAFPHKKYNLIQNIKGEKITYHAFKPMRRRAVIMNKDYDEFMRLLKSVKPDLVHIFFFFLEHSRVAAIACNKLNIKKVISIQGLVSVIEKHMNANLPFRAIYGVTIRNILLQDNVIGLKQKFRRRGISEIDALKNTDNFIGRTSWDHAVTSQVNRSANYYFCNETLRDKFYSEKWNFNKCEKYSIFLSQGQYSIKGLHFAIEALEIIRDEFPTVKMYVSGKDITKADTFKNKLLMTYYGKYIKRLIKKKKLDNNVIFTGPLNEDEMCSKFLDSHVFVSASTIENESNSLSEAKILGVPSVASYVGGVVDRINHGVDGFHYQHDAPYMLAYYVSEIFRDVKLAESLSHNSVINANKIHDQEANTARLLSIYTSIV